ncbi:MAG: class I tRNA ligase family protein, partial [bacterium]|nr:class I tRNA ligase family protein [bacterium]
YPHCWRTGDELIFRLVDEWYISMDWREEIKEMAQRVNWLPPAMRGLERELDWLTTMRNWMISKKRYWGLALPVWECPACSHFDVIGSREELEERAVEGWDRFEGHSPHRPYVDWIKIKCTKCGELAARVPDVGNPWLDAGIVAYSTVGYTSDREYWDQWIPADLITECFPGQFRNWFYSMLAMSTMMEMGKEEKRPPFKNLLGHAMVLDEKRQVMHKSDGTAIWFEEAAEQIGVDTMRWMYCAQPPTVDLPFGLRHPGEEITVEGDDGEVITHTVSGERLCRVSSTPADETRRRVLLPLWNSYAFFCNYARLDEFDPSAPPVPLEKRQDIDRWILSDLQLLVATVHEHFQRYELAPVCHSLEKFLEDLSTWYIRRNRRRFWRGASEGDTDKLAAYQTLYEVLVTLAKLMAPIVPFVTERIYQNLVAEQIEDTPESIHLCTFPQPNESRIDHALSDKMAAVLRMVSLGRYARTVAKLKVRQPLAELLVVPAGDTDAGAVQQFETHLLEELNVKKVTVKASVGDMRTIQVGLNKKLAGPKYGRRLGEIAAALAKLDPAAVLEAVEKGLWVTVQVGEDTINLEPAEVTVVKNYGDDWAVAEDRGTVVLLDQRITPELRNEGLARDIVRNVQNLRKDAGLNMEDRIVLSLRTDADELNAAITACADYITAETLASELKNTALDCPSGTTEVKLAGHTLHISLGRT